MIPIMRIIEILVLNGITNKVTVEYKRIEYQISTAQCSLITGEQEVDKH